MEKKEKTNVIEVVGVIENNPVFCYETHDERFYNFTVAVSRTSGAIDHITVRASGFIINPAEDFAGKIVRIKGQLRSRHVRENNAPKTNQKFVEDSSELTKNISFMERYLFLSSIEPVTEEESQNFESNNMVKLDCYICKPSVFRQTSLSRLDIADVYVAVNREYRGADYIHLLVWGRKGNMAAKLPVGTHLQITGRLQSRLNTLYQQIVLEVSVSKFIVLDGSTIPSQEKLENYQRKDSEEVSV